MKPSRLLLLALTTTSLAACTQPPDTSKQRSADGGQFSEKEQNLLSIAGSARASGDLDGAADLYRRMTNTSGDSIVPHLELASIYRQQRKPALAVDVLREAQKTQPKDPFVLRALGGALVADNKPRDGLVSFEEALALDENDISALNGRGVAYDAMGQHAKAQDSYRRALLVNANNTAVLNNLALSMILSDKYDDAIAILERLTAAPDSTPTMRQNLALAYGLQGNRAKAMEMGLKDLSAEQAQENLKFYEYYQNMKKAGEPTFQAVPVAAVDRKPVQGEKPVEQAAPAVTPPVEAKPVEQATPVAKEEPASVAAQLPAEPPEEPAPPAIAAEDKPVETPAEPAPPQVAEEPKSAAEVPPVEQAAPAEPEPPPINEPAEPPPPQVAEEPAPVAPAEPALAAEQPEAPDEHVSPREGEGYAEEPAAVEPDAPADYAEPPPPEEPAQNVAEEQPPAEEHESLAPAAGLPTPEQSSGSAQAGEEEAPPPEEPVKEAEDPYTAHKHEGSGFGYRELGTEE